MGRERTENARGGGLRSIWAVALCLGTAGSAVARMDREMAEIQAPLTSWMARIQADIQRSEYDFTEAGEGVLSAPNRAFDLRLRIHRGSVDVFPRGAKATGLGARWNVCLTLASWGRDGLMNPVGPATALVEGNRIELERRSMTEWYVNDAQGIEQGFTIPSAPSATGVDSPLVLEMTLDGGLGADLSEDGQAVTFVDGTTSVLRYAELKVFDATGRGLDARIAVNPGRLQIRVDDRGAVYPLLVDPLMTTPDWSVTAGQPSADLGWSVSTAGDVNGDGFSDVILGAPKFDGGNTAEGKAFVYTGSASGLQTLAAWTFESDQDDAELGTSVSTAGDVNGDGYDDVIVGAHQFDHGEANEGRAWVFLGSAGGLQTGPAWTAESDQATASFGISVSNAGDIDADGFADVVVGAEDFDSGDGPRGKVYVYHGSAGGLSAAPDWTGVGNLSSSNFGQSVSTAGDVNGDGFADVVIGDGQYLGGRGSIVLYLGTAGGLSTSTAQWATGSTAGLRMGYSVCTAGDVDGDGYGDVIVGGPGGFSPYAVGRFFIFSGTAAGIGSSPSLTVMGGLSFAQSVSTAGDIDGDGFSDVIVGYPYDNTAGQGYGRAMVHRGSAAGLVTTPTWELYGSMYEKTVGHSVCTAGDVNGDGFSDVIVGTLFSSDGMVNLGGMAAVFHGSADVPEANASWSVAGGLAGASLGVSVASAGDVNGDGHSDVIVGAPDYDNKGRAFLYHGSTSGLSTTADWSVEGTLDSGRYGQSVATAGDVDGDGFSDVIVGAPNHDRAFVYLGSLSGMSTTPVWTGVTLGGGGQYGHSVSTAGDVNGDGLSDVIVGQFYFESGGHVDEGAAGVYLGTSGGVAANPIWVVEGNADSANLGLSVSTAGDVNGDGFSDVIVGIPGTDSAAVYHGSSGGPSTSADWTKTASQTSSGFGSSVASAGDVDGDGYSDVLVGAPGHDGTFTDQGRVQLFMGSAAGLAATSAWNKRGGQDLAYMGTSVASAGDVNGDGYSDVIVGEPFRDQQFMDEGRARLFLGSAAGIAGGSVWSVKGGADNANLGYVASAGDVDGDGLADVIVGAPGWPEGRAQLFLGNAGGGLDRIPRQLRSKDISPIALLGTTGSDGYFRVLARGRTPAGRARISLEWELKPLFVPLDGNGLARSPVPYDTGSGVVQIDELIFGLDGAKAYHWRARVVSEDPFFPRGPWVSIPGNNVTEAKIRRSVTPQLHPPPRRWSANRVVIHH